MSIGRRSVRLEDEGSWVFNRMVEAYEARPRYPEALVASLCDLAGEKGARVADVGAGLGHLALPLAERGYRVTCVEPAQRMLSRLQQLAEPHGDLLECVHGAAEALQLDDAQFDLVLVADAVHFLDSERTAYELSRILRPEGALALVTCEFDDTPFMRAVVRTMEQAAPRRPRAIASALTELLVVAGAPQAPPKVFTDQTPVDLSQLELILKSISFIGPAMNRARFSAFRERIRAIDAPPVWARRFCLYGGPRDSNRAKSRTPNK